MSAPPPGPADAGAPAAPRAFGAKAAWLVFLAFVGAQFAGGLVAGILVAVCLGVERRYGGAAAAVATARLGVPFAAVLGMLASGLAAYGLTKRMARRGPSGGSLVPFGWSTGPRSLRLAAALAGMLLGLAFLVVASWILPPSKDFRPGPVARGIVSGGWPFYVWAFLAVAVAPPVEEFMFRGVLWTGLRESWNPILAGAMVTAVFVVLHLPEAWGYAPALVSIGALGLMALAARIVSGALGPPIFLHAGYNAVIMIAMFASFG